MKKQDGHPRRLASMKSGGKLNTARRQQAHVNYSVTCDATTVRGSDVKTASGVHEAYVPVLAVSSNLIDDLAVRPLNGNCN